MLNCHLIHSNCSSPSHLNLVAQAVKVALEQIDLEWIDQIDRHYGTLAVGTCFD